MVFEQHSIFYYLLLLTLSAGAMYGMMVGLLFLLKRSGEKRANASFAFLLLSFAFTLLHNVFVIAHVYESYPRLRFLPIYFTLAFPPLLFYYVKINCYPAYHFRWTDAKHFVLPGGQFLFFLVLFLLPVSVKSQYDRHFYNPFYGAFEQFLYLSTFYAYLYFAYRYVIQRRRQEKKSPVHHADTMKRVLYLEKLLQILFFFFCIHTAFVIADWASYEFLNINLRAVRPYAAMGALSFASLVYWLSIYGTQVLIWGRRVFRNRKPGFKTTAP